MTDQHLIQLALFLTLTFASYKVWSYVMQWVEYKKGRKIRNQCVILGTVIAMTLLFLTNRQLAWMMTSISSFVWAVTSLSALHIQKKTLKIIASNYITVSVELHRLKKIGWDKSMKADKLYDTENQLWDMLPEKYQHQIRNDLPNIIEKYDDYIAKNS